MKRLMSISFAAILFASCADAGDHTAQPNDNMQSSKPTSDPNGGGNQPQNTSAGPTLDSSTNLAYDTAARKQQNR